MYLKNYILKIFYKVHLIILVMSLQFYFCGSTIVKTKNRLNLKTEDGFIFNKIYVTL